MKLQDLLQENFADGRKPGRKGLAKPLEDFQQDWGVCSNPSAPRAGLLTWEHQAGYNCFESVK